MIKNKAAAQITAIVILSLLLVSTLVFGIVYIYLNKDKIHKAGQIEFINLKVDMYTTHSEKQTINIPNGINVLPDTELSNTALYIENNSNINVFLAVVYEINAVQIDEHGNDIPNSKITDSKIKPFIDLNTPFYNIDHNIAYTGTNPDWIDFIFVSPTNGKAYRCLISTKSYVKTTDEKQEIEVIGTNQFRIHGDVGNEYQQAKVSMSFQAFAINSSSFNFAVVQTAEQCDLVMNAIYQMDVTKF